MEWYYESGGGEELVTSEHEQPHVVSENVELSSERWNQWGICENENFDSPNKYFVGGRKYIDEILSSHNKFSDEVEMDLFSHERDQSSVLTALNPSGIRSMFTEDQPRIPSKESRQNDGKFLPEWNTAKLVDLSEHSTVDTYCGSSEMWDFSLSPEHNNTNFVTSHPPSVSMEMDFASVRARVENASVPAENDNMSVEESLLLDFELVMNQMSEKTRYCFRDAFYRLAKNSECPSNNQISRDGNLISIPCEYDESLRYESEAKTNTIDRTVASLMFSNMNFSLEDHQLQQA